MKNEYIPIRFSHLLGYSGPGAIVRGPNSLMVVQDTTQWTDKDGNNGATKILYVDRVRYTLGVYPKELYAPPAAQKLQRGPAETEGVCIPATRFPRWMKCPRCGRLYPQNVWKAQKITQPICTDPAGNDAKKCQNVSLEQVQYVIVHENGYMSDLDWHFLAHKDGNHQCMIRDKLVLEANANDNKIYLRCDACQSKAIFNENEPQNFGNENEQPWRYDRPVLKEYRYDDKARIRKVNDSRVYSPVTESALIIPPESRLKKGTPVDLLYRSTDDRRQLSTLEGKTDLHRKYILNNLAEKYKCEIVDIYEAIEDIENGYPYYGENFFNSQLLEDEYHAFLDETPTIYSGDEDFITHHYTAQWWEFIESMVCQSATSSRAQAIKHLIKVSRLKEVRVFKGFTRENGEKLVPPAIVKPDISGQSDWLPAIELYGEGIFFALDEYLLAAWEQDEHVQNRLRPIERRFVALAQSEPQKLTARFLLLHTLSHLLIRQLEVTGGYPAASLTERLYCNEGTAKKPMAGILIYTTAPDISGTLGGLAELAEPKRFLGILSQALDAATWCSSDPVCSEHEGQGAALLNLAACHACALVPDTACAYGNNLLDRVIVKGDLSRGVPSLFDGEVD